MKRAAYIRNIEIEGNRRLYKYNTYCECGKVYTNEDTERSFCDECKENLIKKYIWSSESNYKNISETFEFTRYECEWESQSGFEINNFTDTYNFSSEKFSYVKTSKPYKLIVDFKNGVYKLVDRRDKESDITEVRARTFFKSCWGFKKCLKLDTNKSFIDVIEELGQLKTSYSYSAARSFDKCFKNEKFAKIVQILISSGLGYNVVSDLTLVKDRWDHRASIRKNVLNFDETKPHKILKTTKANLKAIKYYPCNDKYNEWIKEVNKLNQNNLVYMIKMLENELNDGQIREFFKHIELFNQIIEVHNYKPQQLIKYLVRDIKIEQGIENPYEGMVLLRDLNRMCKDMRVKPKERYSKSLKLQHDIVSINYKVSIDSAKKNKFIKIISSDAYKEKEYKGKELSIITPLEPNDLIKEGKDMSHCVASYVNSVIDNKCEIYFVRENTRLDKSLVTIEVRNNSIVQAKAFANSKPTTEQKEFISHWAKNKNLVESYY